MAAPAVSHGLVNVPDLAIVWHGFRMVTGSFTLLTGAALGLWWGWWGGYVAAGLAGAAVVDAWHRRRSPERSPMPAMVLDVTLIGVAMVVVQLEPAGIGAPFLYMMVVPALLLPWRQAWYIMGYAVAWTLAALIGVDVVPLAATASPDVITGVAYLIFAGHTVSLVVLVSGALDRSHRAKDQFLAAISHEIRTPLTSILGWSRVLRDAFVSLDTSERAEALQLIEAEAEEVTDIVEDLLTAAQLDIGVVAVQQQPIDLVAEAQAVLAAKSPDPRKTIEVRGSTSSASGDPLRVRQIIRNLISNALRYGGDEISITISTKASQHTLTVSDNGPGIPQELQHRIFEPYVRAGGNNVPQQAVGLGLTVSRNLARLMGGDLQYRRVSGATVFELALPVAPPRESTTIDTAHNTRSIASQQTTVPSQSRSLATSSTVVTGAERPGTIYEPAGGPWTANSAKPDPNQPPNLQHRPTVPQP